MCEALTPIFSDKRKRKCSTKKGGGSPTGDLRIIVPKRLETGKGQRERNFGELSAQD